MITRVFPPLGDFKDKTKDFRLTPKEAFTTWCTYKRATWDSIKANDTSRMMPVIFIATQGGGIRGEVWTSAVLNYLRRTIPGFYNQVFCIGGASGGTVGAVYYNAFVYDSLQHLGDTLFKFDNFLKFAAADCLSPVTASFAFGENVQRLLPFKVPFLDRSKVTMQAFSSSYENHMKSRFADAPFLSMYYKSDEGKSFNCEVPSLFINGTLAETGQRVITSNLKIQGLNNFSNDVDFFDRSRAHISIAAASLNCMRFPLLLSGGLFADSSHTIGHIVDGGYLENTGLQAMYSLISELQDSFKVYRIKPILLYIRNGSKEYEPDSSKNNAFTILHDIRTPLTTLVKVNGTSIPALGIMKMIDQQVANGNPLNMYSNQVWLKDPGYRDDVYKPNYPNLAHDTFPLGLYISDSALERMQQRADLLGNVNKKLVDSLKYYFRRKS